MSALEALRDQMESVSALADHDKSPATANSNGNNKKRHALKQRLEELTQMRSRQVRILT